VPAVGANAGGASGRAFSRVLPAPQRSDLVISHLLLRAHRTALALKHDQGADRQAGQHILAFPGER
jgi:hypothetical protein